jgi:hypothetical protein
MFRFTIRDVLWLTVVVALGVGWMIHYQRMALAVKAADAKTAEVESFCESMGEHVPWNNDRTRVIRTQSPAYFP